MFLLRPEHREGSFLTSHAADLDGAILLGRHLAPYPVGSSGQLEGLRGDELAQEARAARVSHIHDPDTAVIPVLPKDTARKRFGRAHEMLSARSVPAGVSAADLGSERQLQALVLTTLRPQLSVSLPAAPYFRFTSLRDPWLNVNLLAAAMTQAIRREPTVVFVQVDVAAMRQGVLAQASGLYQQALAGGGVAFLQVAGLDPESCDIDVLHAYLDAIAVWREAGLTVIADRVGRFGVAAVGAGASGTASGTRVYRILSDVQLEHQYTRSGKLRYWAPRRGDSLPLKDARKRHTTGSLPSCPVADCDVLAGDSTANEIRWHDIHLVMDELKEVVDDPAAFAAQWSESPRKHVRTWGQTLDRQIRRSQQA